jgi:hypothetical protein
MPKKIKQAVIICQKKLNVVVLAAGFYGAACPKAAIVLIFRKSCSCVSGVLQQE